MLQTGPGLQRWTIKSNSAVVRQSYLRFPEPANITLHPTAAALSSSDRG